MTCHFFAIVVLLATMIGVFRVYGVRVSNLLPRMLCGRFLDDPDCHQYLTDFI